MEINLLKIVCCDIRKVAKKKSIRVGRGLRLIFLFFFFDYYIYRFNGNIFFF